MKFILQMARREMRSSWRRLVFFFLCIAIGVGSIVALRSMVQNVHRAVAGEARALLTADVRLDSDRAWDPAILEKIDRAATPDLVEARTETIESATMLVPTDIFLDGVTMVELKGVERGFPLVGEFILTSGERYNYSLLENNGAVVSVALLDRLELQVGDEVRIGSTTFTIRGAFREEPGGGGGFRLGPRVFIDRAALDEAGLTGFGSRARRRVFFRTPEGKMEALQTRLKSELKGTLIGVRSYKDSEESLNEQYTRAEDYLSLTGLIILVLGGIGISNVTRVFIDQKRKSIAVLKCLGAAGPRIFTIYVIQVIALGLVGSVLGVGIAKAAVFAAGRYYSESLPPNLSYDLQWSAILQGLGIGVLVALLFSALPLLKIRRIKPNVLLRDAVEAPARRFDLFLWITGGVVLAGLVMLVSWQAGSLRVGLLFLGGLAATAIVLSLAAELLIRLVKRFRRISSFPLRQAINSLHRPGNQTRVILMVVGLGVFLVIATQSLQTNLLREFDIGRQGELPNMFLIDVQRDQAEGVERYVAERTATKPALIPTVRVRIAEINGRELNLEEIDTRRERGRLGREYVVTYRPTLEVNETVVKGAFWDPSPSQEAEVSIEESMIGLGGLDIGSTITFDIQGRKLTARVTSAREVDWRNSRMGFMILFRPGPLDDAPQMMIGAISGPADEIERSRFQRGLIDLYPNISVIDVANIVETIKRIVNNISLAVSFIGAFIFLSGSLILIGSIAMTKFQRVYESAVLKTLGAKRRVLLSIMLAEYSLLGVVSGIIGSLGAVGLSWASSKYIFEIPWTFTPEINALGVGGTVALVVIVGVAATIDVLSKKPLGILRAQ